MHIALVANGALLTLAPEAPGWPGEGGVPSDGSPAGLAWRLWSSGQYAITRDDSCRCIRFDVEALLALDDGELRDLGLPRRFSGRVGIEEVGYANAAHYDWRFRWEDTSGRLIADAPPLGPWFPGPRGFELLTAPLADIAELHARLSRTRGEEDGHRLRLQLLARMQRLAAGCGGMVHLPGARKVVEVDRLRVRISASDDGTPIATGVPAKS